MLRPLLVLTLGLAACGGDSGPSTVSVEGDVLEFLNEVYGPRVVGATVTILEHPEKVVTTGVDAHFRFDGLEPGTDLTLVVEHPLFKKTQTATVTLGPGGIDAFAVQIVTINLFDVLSTIVPMPPEFDRFCAIASTAARMGGSLYAYHRQGLPGVSVTLDPPLAPESGPLYFNEMVIPDAEQPSTSIDGGVLFYRIPPGAYTMTATRGDAVFNSVRFQCTAGVIVNAGPPMGLLANVPAPDHALGRALADDAYTASTDALCDATEACVDATASEDDYPAAMLASCKAMFRNTWAFVDVDCDADAALREAARAFYACRASSCENTLGGDRVCVPEEEAFRAAEATYGACVLAGRQPGA